MGLLIHSLSTMGMGCRASEGVGSVGWEKPLMDPKQHLAVLVGCRVPYPGQALGKAGSDQGDFT